MVGPITTIWTHIKIRIGHIADFLAAISIIITASVWVLSKVDRNTQDEASAWQTINLSNSSMSDGGRRKAVEQLIEGGSNLAYTRLVNADFRDFTFRGGNLSHVDFTGSALINTNFTSSTPIIAFIHNRFGYSIEFPCNLSEIGNLSDWFDWLCTKSTPSNLSSANFARAKIIGSNFGNSKLHRAKFDGTIVAQTSFANAELYGASFNAPHGENREIQTAGSIDGNFVNAKMNNIQIYNIAFVNSDFSGAVLDGGTIVNVSFINSNLSQVSWREAKLENINFINTTFNSNDLDKVGKCSDIKVDGTAFALTCLGDN